MKILFVCKHNRFRSKVAEALFNKLNKNEENSAFSAGVSLDKERMYVAENVKRALRLFGVSNVRDKPQKLTKELVRRADIIVNVANDVKPVWKRLSSKTINWNVSDTSQHNFLGILWRVYVIKRKVKKLIRDLDLGE